MPALNTFEQNLLDRFRDFRIAFAALANASYVAAGSSLIMTAEEKTKLAGISDAAQVNVIETVKVDNVALPVENKSVNLSSQTLLSTLPATQEGGVWFEVVNGEPQLKIIHGGESFAF